MSCETLNSIHCKTAVSSKCTECDDTYYLDSTVAAVPTCSACTSPCTTCSTSATTCLTCVNGYYLSGTTCPACVTGCATCSSSSICTICTA